MGKTIYLSETNIMFACTTDLRDSPTENIALWFLPCSVLKTLVTICNCQRLVFTVGVSEHMHKITNLWKFELNRSSKLQDNNGKKKKKNPSHTKLCAFRCLISRPQILNQIRGKLLLSRKLFYFRGRRFSQCFILSTSPHYSLPRKVLC